MPYNVAKMIFQDFLMMTSNFSITRNDSLSQNN